MESSSPEIYALLDISESRFQQKRTLPNCGVEFFETGDPEEAMFRKLAASEEKHPDRTWIPIKINPGEGYKEMKVGQEIRGNSLDQTIEAYVKNFLDRAMKIAEIEGFTETEFA